MSPNQNSENRMYRLTKPKSNKANTSNLYPRRSVILEKRVDHKSPTPKFSLGVICLFVCFDYLRHSQQLFSHVGTGIPGLSQY